MKELIKEEWNTYNWMKASERGGIEEINGTVLEGINGKHKKGEAGRN
jgi:hypothetical protein